MVTDSGWGVDLRNCFLLLVRFRWAKKKSGGGSIVDAELVVNLGRLLILETSPRVTTIPWKFT